MERRNYGQKQCKETLKPTVCGKKCGKNSASFTHVPIRQPADREQAALRANEVKLAKRVRRECEEDLPEAVPA